MNKAEKFLVALSALCVVLTLVYFALPAPQAVFSVRPLAAAGTPAPESRLDINRATAEQLEQLPGIGAVLAGRIVQYREEHGPFASVEELTAVEGIGEARLAAIEDYICCQKETP